VRSPELVPHARTIGRLIHRFGLTVVRTLIGHREAILDRQLIQEPIAQAAMELFASVCVLSRRDAELQATRRPSAAAASWEPAAATLFLAQSARRIRQAFRDIHNHDNAAVTRAAAAVLDAETLKGSGVFVRHEARSAANIRPLFCQK